MTTNTWMILTLLMAGSITPASMLFLTTPLIRSNPVLFNQNCTQRMIKRSIWGLSMTRNASKIQAKERHRHIIPPSNHVEAINLSWGTDPARCCLSAFVWALWWYARSLATSSVESLAAFTDKTCLFPTKRFESGYKQGAKSKDSSYQYMM